MFNKTKGIKNSSMFIFVTAHSDTGIKRSLTSLLICKARWFRNASTAMRIFGTISRRTISRKRCEGKKRFALRATWANFRYLLSKKSEFRNIVNRKNKFYLHCTNHAAAKSRPIIPARISLRVFARN